MTNAGKGTAVRWRHRGLLYIAVALGIIHASRAYGQDASTAPDVADEAVVPPEALAPDTGTGRVGQRQTRAAAAETIGIEPLGRINNRIQNRVQSRIRNRIDEDYDSRANADAPFKVADEQIRAATGPRRR